MNAARTQEVDHKNNDGLDNTRSNLRFATRRQNQANRRAPAGTSKYKGVHWEHSRGKWSAALKTDGRRINLGRYDSEEEAAKAYDTAAQHVWGDFAKLNFPLQS